MYIQANWREIVKKVNGTSSSVGWNTGEGLGMSGFEYVSGGENPTDGAAVWKAGNRLIIVNSNKDNTAILEMREYLQDDDPADLLALDTWKKLSELIITVVLQI